MKRYTWSLIAAVFLACLFTGWVYAQDVVPVVPGQVPQNQAAVPVTNVPSNALPDHAQEQISWGLVAMLLLQYLKKSNRFPVISEADTARAKATWGFVMALLSAAGIHFAISGSLFDATGATITISGVSWAAFKDIVFQWAFQQGWYQLLVKQTAAPQL